MASLPRSAEARACARLYAAAAAALYELYPLLRTQAEAAPPKSDTLCGLCCALIASGGVEDGSGGIAVGKSGSKRLACPDAVRELCEQSRVWWDAKQQEIEPQQAGPSMRG